MEDCLCFQIGGGGLLFHPQQRLDGFPGDSIILWGAVYYRYIQKLIFVLNVYLDAEL